MFLTLKNVGRGRTFIARANLKNLSGAGVLLRDARFDINDMMPGEERRVAFTFDVAQSFRQDELKLELVVEDEDLREVTSQKLRVPIAQAGAPVTAATGAFVAAAALELRESPASDARVILRAPAGSGFPTTAQSGEWVRVDALDGLTGLGAPGAGRRHPLERPRARSPSCCTTRRRSSRATVRWRSRRAARPSTSRARPRTRTASSTSTSSSGPTRSSTCPTATRPTPTG
ncbi:MAG: hypothetical protein IPF99_27130 [Deltaproteobacteria bacterium]|nr:hypothetical protein [Deltaproteobacteria bacterium]